MKYYTAENKNSSIPVKKNEMALTSEQWFLVFVVWD
jgi:hypothetical protein